MPDYGIFEELIGEAARNAGMILFNRIFSPVASSTIHGHEHGEAGKIDDSNRVRAIPDRIRITKLTGWYDSR